MVSKGGAEQYEVETLVAYLAEIYGPGLRADPEVCIECVLLQLGWVTWSCWSKPYAPLRRSVTWRMRTVALAMRCLSSYRARGGRRDFSSRIAFDTPKTRRISALLRRRPADKTRLPIVLVGGLRSRQRSHEQAVRCMAGPVSAFYSGIAGIKFSAGAHTGAHRALLAPPQGVVPTFPVAEEEDLPSVTVQILLVRRTAMSQYRSPEQPVPLTGPPIGWRSRYLTTPTMRRSRLWISRPFGYARKACESRCCVGLRHWVTRQGRSLQEPVRLSGTTSRSSMRTSTLLLTS